MYTAIIFILVLSILVFVHELGHFLTARKLGVKAEEFGFGFPPRAIGVYRSRGGRWLRLLGNRSLEDLESENDEKRRPAAKATVYSLNWLPLGGFVKIKGENGEGDDAGDSFISKKIRVRIAILAAGVIMNVLLAWLLFSAGYIIGLPQSTSELGRGARVSEAQVMIAEALPGTPAQLAGLKAGDAVLEIEGEVIRTESELQSAIGARPGVETKLKIKRAEGGAVEELTITPQDKEGRGLIGVSIFASGLVRYPFFLAFWEGLKTTVWMLGQIFAAFWGLLIGLFSANKIVAEFAGPVGIATITGQAARLGLSYLLQFTALLSLNLAVINILPFPALDGGRILFLLIEKIKGRPIRRELEASIHAIGFWLLIALILFITYKDIVKLF